MTRLVAVRSNRTGQIYKVLPSRVVTKLMEGWTLTKQPKETTYEQINQALQHKHKTRD